VIARELTKMHEEVISTTVAELMNATKDMVKKGEFAVVIGPQHKR
jgi:16S rRNA C1402 (ribose-2'-O) methylase RsmI